MEITFGDIRKFCSVVDGVSICIFETKSYDNYKSIEDVPSSYNEYYLYGVGVIDSEFFVDKSGKETANAFLSSSINFHMCLEIVLSEKPRNFDNIREKK